MQRKGSFLHRAEDQARVAWPFEARQSLQGLLRCSKGTEEATRKGEQ